MARQTKTGKAAGKAESMASGGNTTKAGSKAKQANKAGSIPADRPVTEPDIMPVDGPGNNAAMPAHQKRRGRPKGSKNKTIRTRPEQQPITDPGDNTKFLNHDLRLLSLPDIDMNNEQAVFDRIKQYFAICSEDDIKPTIESLALSFGLSRFILFDIMNGRNKSRVTNPDSIHTLKKAYNTITSYYAHMMNCGKINPVAGIFLMKNNYGYKDTSEHVITATTEQDPSVSDITERAGLLTE